MTVQGEKQEWSVECWVLRLSESIIPDAPMVAILEDRSSTVDSWSDISLGMLRDWDVAVRCGGGILSDMLTEGRIKKRISVNRTSQRIHCRLT